MKKFTAFFLALTLLVAAAAYTGCSDQTKKPTNDPSSAVSETTSAGETLPSGEAESSGDKPGNGTNTDSKPKRETYGSVVDDGKLKYRLVNREFYEVVEMMSIDVTGVDLNDTENLPYVDLVIPATKGNKPVTRIRGELDFETAEKIDPFTQFNGHSGAFSSNTLLRTVQISEGITTIGFGAFINCRKLMEVSLPASLTEFAEDFLEDPRTYSPFYGCRSLENIAVAPGNPAFKSVDGVLFTADGETLIQYPAGKEDTSYQVPAGVKTIAPYAFDGCANLKEIILPEGIETIGNNVFNDCTVLETVKIPKTVTFLAENAFYDCTVLTAIEVADGNTAYKSLDGVLFTADGATILKYPDAKTASEYTVPEGVKNVPFSAFGGFDGALALKKIFLPSTLEETTNHFPDNVEEIVVAEGCKAYKSLDGVLFTADGETMFCYPRSKTDESYVIPEGVKEFISYFNGNPFLKKLTLPASFAETEDIVYIDFPLLEEIHVAEGSKAYKSVDGVLYDASGETMLVYPEQKPSESYTVPEGVKTIPAQAGLMKNTHLKKITLPASLETIEKDRNWDTDYYGDEYFGSAMEEIIVADGCEAYSSVDGMLLNGKGSKLLCYPAAKPGSDVTLPDTIQTIAEDAIVSPQHIKTLRLPKGLRTIESQAIYIHNELLEAIYIPGGVQLIEYAGLSTHWSAVAYCSAASEPTTWHRIWRVYDFEGVEDVDNFDRPNVWGYTE